MSEVAPPAHTLLVHGGSHGSWCWDAAIKGLRSAGVSTSAFDLPGCGSDHTPRANLRLADSVASLLTAIDNLPPGSVRVVGHSIGGWLLPYAAAEPQRVTELERNFSAAQIATFADKVGVEVEAAEGDHCVMLTNPDVLVACLLGGG